MKDFEKDYYLRSFIKNAEDLCADCIKYESFLTWQLRNVHQPVYTGPQRVKGIDTPVFQISIFTQKLEDGFTIENQIAQALHGYQGQFGGTGGFWIAKADLMWLYNTFDDTIGMHQIILDCTLDIPA